MNKKLTIATLALLAVACSNDDVLVQNGGNQETEREILFTSIADKVTRGDHIGDFALELYHGTFAVYGTKTSYVDGEVSYVFGDNPTAITQTTKYNGVTCTYVEDSDDLAGEWVYSPHRYWDTQALYNFIAYTPASAPIRYIYGAEGDETGTTGYKFLSTQPYTIVGQNLQATDPQATEKNYGFTGGSNQDTDIMISDPVSADGHLHKTSNPSVDLLFHHTLAKINIRMDVQKNEPEEGEAGYRVNVKSVTLADLFSKGEFDSSRDSVWVADTTQATGTKVTYRYNTPTTTGEKLDSIGTYFVEGLVMPQEISADQTIVLRYTITSIGEDGSEHIENFTYKTTLGEVFGIDNATPIATDFLSNCNYTVSFHLNPEKNVIKFDAGVYEWEQNYSNTQDVD